MMLTCKDVDITLYKMWPLWIFIVVDIVWLMMAFQYYQHIVILQDPAQQYEIGCIPPLPWVCCVSGLRVTVPWGPPPPPCCHRAVTGGRRHSKAMAGAALVHWGRCPIGGVINFRLSKAWEFSGFYQISGILPLAKYLKSGRNLS